MSHALSSFPRRWLSPKAAHGADTGSRFIADPLSHGVLAADLPLQGPYIPGFMPRGGSWLDMTAQAFYTHVQFVASSFDAMLPIHWPLAGAHRPCKPSPARSSRLIPSVACRRD